MHRITIIIITGFILLFTYSCSNKESFSPLAYSIINRHAEQCEENNGLVLGGSGGSWTAEMRTLIVHYNGYRQMHIPEARKLYVKSVDSLLTLVNADPLIRPYLRDFPCTWKNIELWLSFKKPGTYERPPNGYVAFMAVANDCLFYQTWDESTGNLKTIYEEPYEEAERIVHEQVSN